VHLDLAAFEGAREVLAKVQLVAGLLPHVRAVELPAAPVVVLGPVEGGVGAGE
jgi:hypothetical protein